MSEFVVCYRGSGEKEIEAELKKLDPNLFLDKEIAYRGGPVFYIVKHWIGSGHPPVPVVEWRERNGTPKPLCHALVEQVKKQEGRLDGAVQRILKQHEEVHERRRAQSREEHEAVTREHLPRMKAAQADNFTPFWRPKHRKFGSDSPSKASWPPIDQKD